MVTIGATTELYFKLTLYECNHFKIHTQQPNFLTKLRNLENAREGQRAHFEAKLEPITDPHLQVEWLKNGEPIIIGHRLEGTIKEFLSL